MQKIKSSDRRIEFAWIIESINDYKDQYTLIKQSTVFNYYTHFKWFLKMKKATYSRFNKFDVINTIHGNRMNFIR